MSVPNIGPELPTHGDPENTDGNRRGNPALAFRDEPHTDEVEAATARASTVSHRFGGVRHALSRPALNPTEEPDGDPDARA